ncbi:MAG: ROK family protein [Candidatus Omnitrophota bacterium]
MSISKDGLFKFQVLNEKQRKNLIILNAIKKGGQVSKSDLAKQTGYNIVTLSNYIEEYKSKGLVYETGLDSPSGGRPPVLLALKKQESYLVGVDFGLDAINAIITDLQLNIVAELTAPRPEIEQENVASSLISVIGDLIKKSRIENEKIRHISIGFYGAIEEKNGAVKWLDEEKGRSRATIYYTTLKKAIENEFNIGTFFGSDVTFAAFGERTQNPAADIENLLYVFKDIGRGVVIKGEIYCGTNTAQDLDGLTGGLRPEEKAKLSKDVNYLRPWKRGMSLLEEARKVLESGVGTTIVEILKGDMGQLTEATIIKAAGQKDEVAVELIETIGINLGVKVSYLINLFSPQAVFIGGGIEKAGSLLFDTIRKTIDKLTLEDSLKNVKLYPSILGDRAVAVGAAAAGLREVFLEA